VAKLKFDPTKTLSFIDPRETPTYGIPEAAHYLRLPVATLRSWVLGRYYPTKAARRRFKPLIEIADSKHNLLSFENLAEAHVLSAFRRIHGVRMENIRAALLYVTNQLKCDHPFISQDFETNGVSLFVTQLGKLIDASAHGQQAMRILLHEHLKRLEREDRRIVRLYPFTRPTMNAENPKSVYVDPRIAFGRLVLASIGIPTADLIERFAAGESIEHLADDYGCEIDDVEEAIRFERAPFDNAA
jgi:uncharacterized protein (DUF433 family)